MSFGRQGRKILDTSRWTSGLYPYLCPQCPPMLCPMKRFLPLLFLFLPLMPYAQVVYEDINNKGIYDFLDELANLKVIEINSVVKPYSRQFIAEKLVEAKEYVSGFQGFRVTEKGKKKKQYRLSKRQEKELEFYLQDYQIDLRCEIPNNKKQITNKDQNPNSKNQIPNKFQKTKSNLQNENSDSLNPEPGTRNAQPETDCSLEYAHKLGFLFKKQAAFAVPLNPLAFQYKDKLFTLSVRPVGGVFYMANENGNMYQRYWGASAFMYIGKNFGGYASLRDNYATELLVKPDYFTLATGGVYKVNEGGRQGGDWSERNERRRYCLVIFFIQHLSV